MREKKALFADLIFGVQVIATAVFGWSQFQRLLGHHQTAHLSWYASWEAFFFVMLLLTLKAYRCNPNWELLKVVLTYALWNVAMSVDLLVLVCLGGHWDGSDSLIASVMGVAAVGIMVWASSRGLTATDAAVKGLLAIAWKGFPQLVMAYCVALPLNHEDITVAAAISGITTMSLRFAQIGIALLLSKKRDRSLVWAFWGETSNVLSWTCAVIARFVL